MAQRNVHAPARVATGAVALAAVAVAAGCSNQHVRRAGLVPHQRPVQATGRTMDATRHEVTLGSPVVADARDPVEARGANVGVAIPRHEITGSWRFRVRDSGDLALMWDHGRNDGARRVSAQQPAVKEGDVMGAGIRGHEALELAESLTVSLAGELWIYSVPFVEHVVCGLCNGPAPAQAPDRDLTPVLAGGVVPRYELTGTIAVYGGLTLRHHPTVERDGHESATADDDGEVDTGPLGAVASGGVEVGIGGGATVTAYAYQPMGGPVRYGPAAGMGVTIPLTRSSTK